MTAKTLIPPEEYLASNYDGPDREYRDGEVIERSMADSLHADTQWRLSGLTYKLADRMKVFGRTEIRVKVRTNRYLVPDFALYVDSCPEDLVPDVPPALVVEILSPSDSMSEIFAKFDDYLTWGVRHVWLFDPHKRRLCRYTGSLQEMDRFELLELGVEFTKKEIFG